MKFIQTLILLAALAFPALGGATIVRIQTSLGVIDIELFDDGAPSTVANFLSYVESGAYDHSFLHRSVPGFVIQGGGYQIVDNAIQPIATRAPVVNEFSAQRSNVRGTVAMAKQANNPDSATNQWFFNLSDNAANLDSQNGGFTVFGRVIGKGMEVVDAMTNLPIRNAGGAYSQLPLMQVPANGSIALSDLVMLDTVTAAAKNSVEEADRLFAYLEGFFPEFLAPAHPLSPAGTGSASAQGYYYRYYSATHAYIGIADGNLYYLGPASNDEILLLGPVADWMAQAEAAGY
ncbi:MAG: peptidylprolyl isomerase [Methylomonas sp.]|nr:peptidylprolyl isomerase [Methylomonas sp.]